MTRLSSKIDLIELLLYYIREVCHITCQKRYSNSISSDLQNAGVTSDVFVCLSLSYFTAGCDQLKTDRWYVTSIHYVIYDQSLSTFFPFLHILHCVRLSWSMPEDKRIVNHWLGIKFASNLSTFIV